MERAIRVASVEKGYDPREFALVAAGGAGPLHAGCLAQVLHIPLVVVPAIPGNFSALGLLYSDLRADFAQTQLIPASAADPAQVTHIFAALDAAALQRLAADRVSAADQLLQRTVDVRYVGQAYEVAVPVPDGSLDAAALAEIVARFHVEHQRLFAHSAGGEPIEFVTFRVAAVGRIVPPTQHRLPGGTQLLEQARKERRPVYFHDHGGFIPCAIYDRERLTPDHALVGPCIVEQADTTTVVYPDQSAVADEFGNLLISPTLPPTLPATLPVTALVTSAQIPSQADQEQRRG